MKVGAKEFRAKR